MAIRMSADWMVQADDRILEFLLEEGNAPPKTISDDERITFSQNYVNRRLYKLHDVGLVQRVGRGVYRITPAGEDYLAGELDAGELEPG